jgi:hypothetical protein
MSKTTVALVYGFGEGEWIGRYFRTRLQAHGFSVIAEPAAADVVIAHSAGCFYLPPTGKEQLTVLIGPPYWPGHSVVWGFLVKFWRDFWYYRHLHRTIPWLHKSLHNNRYILGGLRKSIAIARHTNRHDFYLALQQKRILVIRNEHDTFLTPQAPELLAEHAHISFQTIPGEHDDCWLHPEPYIECLQAALE